MSKINFRMTLSIDETKNLIQTTGDMLTHIVIGQPGVGKSSILKMLREDMGTDEYDFIYVDCPVKDMMDIAASIPNHENKSLEYYVADLFKMDSGKKKVIMLDEFMKAPKLLQVIFTRMMLERTVGDVPLPEGSIVFGTSNNVTDGVGDAMLDHAGNRVCKIHMRNPNASEWDAWAAKQGIARPIPRSSSTRNRRGVNASRIGHWLSAMCWSSVRVLSQRMRWLVRWQARSVKRRRSRWPRSLRLRARSCSHLMWSRTPRVWTCPATPLL